MVELALVRGSLRIPRAAYEAWLGGVEACVVLREGEDLLLLPVRHAGGGGHLLKVRNAAGDRAVSANDVLGDCRDGAVRMTWQEDRAALVARGFFRAL